MVPDGKFDPQDPHGQALVAYIQGCCLNEALGFPVTARCKGSDGCSLELLLRKETGNADIVSDSPIKPAFPVEVAASSGGKTLYFTLTETSITKHPEQSGGRS